MTNGCLRTEESVRGVEKAGVVGVEEERGEDELAAADMRPSRRRPEKCGPDAASIT